MKNFCTLIIALCFVVSAVCLAGIHPPHRHLVSPDACNRVYTKLVSAQQVDRLIQRWQYLLGSGLPLEHVEAKIAAEWANLQLLRLMERTGPEQGLEENRVAWGLVTVGLADQNLTDTGPFCRGKNSTNLRVLFPELYESSAGLATIARFEALTSLGFYFALPPPDMPHSVLGDDYGFVDVRNRVIWLNPKPTMLGPTADMNWPYSIHPATVAVMEIFDAYFSVRTLSGGTFSSIHDRPTQPEFDPGFIRFVYGRQFQAFPQLAEPFRVELRQVMSDAHTSGQEPLPWQADGAGQAWTYWRETRSLQEGWKFHRERSLGGVRRFDDVFLTFDAFELQLAGTMPVIAANRRRLLLKGMEKYVFHGVVELGYDVRPELQCLYDVPLPRAWIRPPR